MEPVYKLRDARLEWREIDGEVVALDLDSARYLAVNRTGTTLWPLLVDGATRAGLVEKLCDDFAIERDRAEGDVDAFLAGLDEQGLLQQS